MKNKIKSITGGLVLVATIAVFIYYFTNHPTALRPLRDISPFVLVAVFILYVLFVGSLALILEATVTLCRITLKTRDSLLITMWSSIINFFGPLQSGPAFRAVYLKKVHGISLKNYGVATLLYYGFYALYSGLFLVSGLVPWPLLVGLIILGGVVGFLVLRSSLGLAKQIRALPLQQTYKLALATLVQVVIIATIYTVELKSLNTHITIHQAIIYSGAANFALFVSLTPGAIGFREAFLVFSQNLHHINQATILTANLIDRSIYIVLLGILFLMATSLHVQDRFSVKKSKAAAS